MVTRVVLMLLAIITCSYAQPHPVCSDTCGGGTQSKGSGGGPMQAMATISNQRGTGSARVAADRAGKSINIEGSQSYTYPVPLFDIPGRGVNLNRIMMGRDAASGSSGAFCFSQLNVFDRLFITADQNTNVNSGYGFVGLYNIGAEHFTLSNSRIWTDTPAWFSTANDLGIGSPYQNLQNGCAASMTLVTLLNDSFLMVSGNGIVVGGNTHDFQLINLHLEGPPGKWPIMFAGTGHSNWYIRGQIEDIHAPAAFIVTGSNLDHFDVDVATAGQVGNSLGYVAFFSQNCCTISNSKFKVTVLNGVPQPMIQNANESFVGGELDLSTTSMASNTGITLTGTLVQAADRSTTQVNFAPGSIYMALGSDGIAFQGTVNFAGPHN